MKPKLGMKAGVQKQVAHAHRVNLGASIWRDMGCDSQLAEEAP